MPLKQNIKQSWRSLRRGLLPFKWEQRYVAMLHYKKYQRLRSYDGSHSLQPFDDHKCIFIHIPKNGGISISNGLFGKDRMLGGHYSVDFYKTVFGSEFNNYYKFAIARNPWDRVVSAYHYLKSGGLDFRDVEWEKKHIHQFHSFEDFVMGWLTPENIYKGMHFIPQHEFICDKKGNIEVDYVGRFETLSCSFEEIAKRIGKKKNIIPHSNSSPRERIYHSYYTELSISKVANVYKRDIDIFDYRF